MFRPLLTIINGCTKVGDEGWSIFENRMNSSGVFKERRESLKRLEKERKIKNDFFRVFGPFKLRLK